MSSAAQEGAAKYKYSFCSAIHPFNAAPFDAESSDLASMVHSAWLDHRFGGRPLSITRAGKTISTEEELKHACALITERDHSNNDMRTVARQVIREMGKQE
ncbi:MAG: hypothetical protein H0T92_16565 [Pyrinomonadaceae bacterium]|jgi:hypothetical protein|nr:hypothetical protein [Pyrinomonadaceae bacterium]